MKTKSFFRALCLSLCLTAACSASAYVGGGKSLTAEAAESAGFHRDSNGKLYYINTAGERVHGPNTITTTKSDGTSVTATYFFDAETGCLVTGSIHTEVYEGLYYLVNASGVVNTTSGLKFVKSTGAIYCVISSSGQLAVNKTVKINGNIYCFDKTGRMFKSGLKGVGKYKYYIKSTKVTSGGVSYTLGVAQTGWQTYKGKKYYFDANGRMQTGITSIDGKKYALNGSGNVRKGAFRSGSNNYYADEDGVIQTGWVYRSDKGAWFYYSAKSSNYGVMQKKTWIKTGSYYAYVGSTGALKTGWFSANGKKYYGRTSGSSPSAGLGARVKSWQTIDGYRYYFNSKGILLYGWQKTKSGTVYYLQPKKGYVMTGWQSLNSDADGNTYSSEFKYYFDPSSKGKMVTGWKTIDGNRYYFRPVKTSVGPKGSMVTGTVKIDGTVYTFSASGVLQSSGSSSNGYTYAAYSGTAMTTTPVSSISGSWKVTVNRQKNIITVYKGNTVVRAMWCSTGVDNATPTGTTTIRTKYSTWTLMGPSYGFYCMHLWDSILFHSIPYSTSNNHYSMYQGAFNKLGTQASHGCIRLAFADTKWIYNNVPSGTTVEVSDTCATPVTPHAITRISDAQTWDPTDDEI